MRFSLRITDDTGYQLAPLQTIDISTLPAEAASWTQTLRFNLYAGPGLLGDGLILRWTPVGIEADDVEPEDCWCGFPRDQHGPGTWQQPPRHFDPDPGGEEG